MTAVLLHKSAVQSLIAAFLAIALVLISYVILEPRVGRTQVSDSFTVTQEITGEISFLVAAADVTMSGTISGITGGYATGTTRAVVQSNDPQGFNMTLRFATTTAGYAMTASSTAYINDYTPASTTPGVPDYNWTDNGTGGSAEFGYTVAASTTADLDPSFLNDGSGCNTGAGQTADKCWLNPTSTPETIISTTGPTPVSGATTTIKFKVAVPSGPTPSLPAAFYVATATLTATNNP
jgi:hypothetical protein